MATKMATSTGKNEQTEGPPQGVVGVLLQQDLESFISTISRLVRRIMAVALNLLKTITPVAIINSYAPHKGYSNQERDRRWKRFEQIIEQIPKTHMAIWRTDENGQLGKQTENKNKYRRAIGRYANKKQTEPGNGQKLLKICEAQDMIPMNTWKRPKLTQKERQTLRNSGKKKANAN